MKITAIETIPVSLPVGKFQDGDDKVIGVDAPERYPTGAFKYRPWNLNAEGTLVLSNVIVKIHTDEGLIGIGEAACDTTEPVEVVLAMIDRHMAPHLIGQDPMNWRHLIDLVSWDKARGSDAFFDIRDRSGAPRSGGQGIGRTGTHAFGRMPKVKGSGLDRGAPQHA